MKPRAEPGMQKHQIDQINYVKKLFLPYFLFQKLSLMAQGVFLFPSDQGVADILDRTIFHSDNGYVFQFGGIPYF